MLDLKALRNNPDTYRKNFEKRGIANQLDLIISQDELVRQLVSELQVLQTEKNNIAQEMSKTSEEEAKKNIRQKGEQIKNAIKEKEEISKVEEDKLQTILINIPNVPDDEVPLGKDENDNKEVRNWGEIPMFDFAPQEHFEIERVKKFMDFETAALVSGSRFVYMKGAIAELHRALKNFFIDTLTKEFGYLEFDTPYIFNANAGFGTAQLPKFEEDLFKTTDDKYLISTSEITLTNYVREKILNIADLPLRFTAATPCFRSEAGACGKDTHGMIRNHQFTKVEMVSICDPESSEAEHQRMTSIAETLLQRLELPYRTMLLCTGDMGFSSKKTYDIEVWLPGQGKYREISSCSNCGDFQARRMKTRYKKEGKNEFVHTLNGSGLPVGRTLVAVLENYQTKDGNVHIPTILHSYMGGRSLLF